MSEVLPEKPECEQVSARPRTAFRAAEPHRSVAASAMRYAWGLGGEMCTKGAAVRAKSGGASRD